MNTLFTARRLNRAFVYNEKDLFGRESRIVLQPRFGNTWTWNPDGNSSVVINPQAVDVRARRMMLKCLGQNGRKYKLEVLEHILCLRATGLIGVEIGGNGWPPYHGRAGELWDLVKSASAPTDEALPLFTVSKPVRYDYSKGKRSRMDRYFCIEPSTDGRLTVEIHVNFPEIGAKTQTFVLPDMKVLEKAFNARTLGYPKWLYWVALTNQWWWPHMDHINWIQDLDDKDDLLDQIILHRLQDLLGEIGLLFGDGMFVGKVTSCCSGHLGGVQTAMMAKDMIVPFHP